MVGPHPPHSAVSSDGTLPYPEDLQGFRGMPAENGTAPLGPLWHPKQRPQRLLIGIGAAIALVTAMTIAIVFGVRTNGASTETTFSEGAAKTAIQEYLAALEHRDIDTIARNALCGIYEGVRDRRPDQALAKLNSDAFRRQYSRAEVTSIDKLVYWSPSQAQALFTLQVAPAAGGPTRTQLQGIAQLLFQRGQILVCSSVLRAAGSY